MKKKKKRRISKIMCHGAHLILPMVYLISQAWNLKKCSQVEYVAIKEADIKVDCDLEDHVDNIFMRLSLE